MEYWRHQKDEPLFPEVIWSKPETKHGSGKLAIIGGTTGAMSRIASAYTKAELAGAGTIYLLVPDSLAKVTKGLPNIQYAPSNPSGGFAKTALSELLAVSENVDGVFLPGDLGKNSETSLMLESYINKYTGLLVIAPDSMNSFAIKISEITRRPNTVVVLSLNQLRELVIGLRLDKPVTSGIGLAQMAEILHDITLGIDCAILVDAGPKVWVAQNGQVVDCDSINFNSSKSSVWAIQQPEKLFEALVSSIR